MSASPDIIHPRNQGTGSEAEFYAPWGDRARAPKQKTAQQRQSRLSDPSFVSRFAAMHRQGMWHVDIAEELNISKSAVYYFRKKLGLKPRRDMLRMETSDVVKLAFWMKTDLYASVRRHCGKRRTMSSFVRDAIREKLERSTFVGN